MNKVFLFGSAILILILSSGCMARESSLASEPVQKEVKEASKVRGEAIVIFNKGVTFNEAKKSLKSHDIIIVKQYKALSEQNGQLYLSVRSSKSTEELVRILQADKDVDSVSSNQKRGLY